MKFTTLRDAALAAAVLAPGAWAVPAPGRVWNVGQKVKTTTGTLKGRAAPSAEGVSEYLGIPYAIPPVGERRFGAPEAYKSTEEIDATKFGYACWQNQSPPISDQVREDMGIPETYDAMFTDLGRWPGDPGPLSEDCLTLNVWTKPQSGDTKKAVLVWFHGGGFSSGSSIYPGYNGKFLANEQDVVVVSINYRLNIFGFPGDPLLSTPNLGFLDARLAMEWIRDNIESFGGDLGRITMFGQSAGAGLVDFYSYAYPDDAIANGFVLLSGVADGGDPPAPKGTASSVWLRIAGAVGCPNATANAEVRECMMAKAPADLIAPLYSDSFATDGPPGPGPVADEKVLFSSYKDRRSAPGGYLVGNTDFEAGMFLPYRPDFSMLVWRTLNDMLFTCPAAQRAKRARDDDHPTWRYRWFGEFPNMMVTTKPSSGAWHGGELPVLFDTVNEDLVPSTEGQKEVGRYMREALAAFAKDTTNGLVEFGWPKYSALSNSLVRLGLHNEAGPHLAIGDTYDLSCIIL